MGGREKLSKHQSHPDYTYPFHANFLRLAETHTEPNIQQTESPTRLYLDSDCPYSPQAMEKGLAHYYFSWVCTVYSVFPSVLKTTQVSA